jgi:DNA-binding GntR family transcriptional regulator
MKGLEQMVQQYCACLREKIQQLEEFKQATLKMKEAAASRDIPRIVRHVKERQGLIGRIEQMDRVLNEFKQGDSFSIERLSHQSKNLARRCLEQLKKALESIAAMDKECLDLALAHHDSMKAEILKIRHGLRAARGYRLAVERHPRFLDVKK